MDNKEAIETIKHNYIPVEYILYRKAMELAVVALEEKIINDKKAKIFKDHGIKYIEIDGKLI